MADTEDDILTLRVTRSNLRRIERQIRAKRRRLERELTRGFQPEPGHINVTVPMLEVYRNLEAHIAQTLGVEVTQ